MAYKSAYMSIYCWYKKGRERHTLLFVFLKLLSRHGHRIARILLCSVVVGVSRVPNEVLEELIRVLLSNDGSSLSSAYNELHGNSRKYSGNKRDGNVDPCLEEWTQLGAGRADIAG